MRAVGGLAALLMVVAATSCTDQGSLMIRCPDPGDVVAVNDGQITVDGVVMHVAADLSVPAAADEGMTVAIDMQLPDSPGHTRPSVLCARMRLAKENVQWDMVPSRIQESYDGTTARVRSIGRDGPHWRIEDPIDVTIWLQTPSGRHVLTLREQLIHRPG